MITGKLAVFDISLSCFWEWGWGWGVVQSSDQSPVQKLAYQSSGYLAFPLRKRLKRSKQARQQAVFLILCESSVCCSPPLSSLPPPPSFSPPSSTIPCSNHLWPTHSIPQPLCQLVPVGIQHGVAMPCHSTVDP